MVPSLRVALTLTAKNAKAFLSFKDGDPGNFFDIVGRHKEVRGMQASKKPKINLSGFCGQERANWILRWMSKERSSQAHNLLESRCPRLDISSDQVKELRRGGESHKRWRKIFEVQIDTNNQMIGGKKTENANIPTISAFNGSHVNYDVSHF